MLYMAQAGYQPSDIQERAESFEEETGIGVQLHFAEYEDQYSLIMNSMDKAVADYDVILLDLIWTAEFAERQIIDPIPPRLVDDVEEGIIPEIHSAFRYDGQMWAFPFLANFQLFYTNTELLHRTGYDRPPRSLDELVEIATAAAESGVIEYPIFLPLRKQEVLICEFVWLVGAFGGDLSDEHGNIDLVSSASREALAFLVDLLDRGLLNPYSLQSAEVFAACASKVGRTILSLPLSCQAGLPGLQGLPLRGSDNPVRRRSLPSSHSRSLTRDPRAAPGPPRPSSPQARTARRFATPPPVRGPRRPAS